MDISIQPTPNPNALKFILDTPVKSDGKSTYRTPRECAHNQLACALFTIRGIDQIHFFQNSITITKFGYESWDAVEPQIKDCLNEKIAAHDPNYSDPDPAAERRKKLPPELLKIEQILDHKIRPGLQGDGGDLICENYENNVLIIKYEGACGTCPSATTGTLEAIKAILRDDFDPDIEVYISPEY